MYHRFKIQGDLYESLCFKTSTQYRLFMFTFLSTTFACYPKKETASDVVVIWTHSVSSIPHELISTAAPYFLILTVHFQSWSHHAGNEYIDQSSA
mmetsp:Transcript_37448/g.57453  ORF Transcript_37448/g.57453 Transcript_37448/m.57453 type:complete len:95 (-) Transcript_37448:621-905(-)